MQMKLSPSFILISYESVQIIIFLTMVFSVGD